MGAGLLNGDDGSWWRGNKKGVAQEHILQGALRAQKFSRPFDHSLPGG